MNLDQVEAEEGPQPISVDELLDARHLAASLATTWDRRLDQEDSLQRVWPVPELAPKGPPPLISPNASAAGSKRPEDRTRRRRRRRGRGVVVEWDEEGSPGEGSQGDSDSGDGLSSEEEGRWLPWLTFLAGRSAEWQDEENVPREGVEVQDGQLRSRVSAALQTAEGLGWEEVTGEGGVHAVVAARLAREGGSLPQRPLAELGLGAALHEGVSGRTAAAAAAGAAAGVTVGAAVAEGEEQSEEAEEGGGRSLMAGEMWAVVQGIAHTMTAQPGQRRRQDPQLRSKLKRVQASALAQATARLEMAVAARAEYEAALLQLRRQRQRQHMPGQNQGQNLGGDSGTAIMAGLAPGGRGSSGVAGCLGIDEAGAGLGPTRGRALQRVQQEGWQQQQQEQEGWQQQQQEQEGWHQQQREQGRQQQQREQGRQQQQRAPGRTGATGGGGSRAAQEGGPWEQPLGFSQAVARLQSVLDRTGLLEGCEGQAGRRLLEQLLWLPGGPWTEGSMARLEEALGDAELLAYVGEDLQQAERRQRHWGPGQQRRPTSAALPANSQLEVLRTRLLPLILPGEVNGAAGAGIGAGQERLQRLAEGAGQLPRSAGAEDASRPQPWVGTQHSVVGLVGSQCSQGRAGAKAGLGQRQGRGEEEERGAPAPGSPQRQQQEELRDGLVRQETRFDELGSEEEEGDLREKRLEAATQAGLGVLWSALDWALRSGTALSAVDTVDEPSTREALKKRRIKATAAALARPALPPLPLSSSGRAAAALLDPAQGPPAREGLPPAVAARLRSAAASGTATLRFLSSTQQGTQAGVPAAEHIATGDPAGLPTVACEWEAGSGAGVGGVASRHRRRGQGTEEGGEGGLAAERPLWQQPTVSFYLPPHPVLARGLWDGDSRQAPAEPQPLCRPGLALDPQRLGDRTAVRVFWEGGATGKRKVRSKSPVLLARAAMQPRQRTQQRQEQEEHGKQTERLVAEQRQQQQQQGRQQLGQRQAISALPQQSAAGAPAGTAPASSRSTGGGLGSNPSAFQAWGGANKEGQPGAAAVAAPEPAAEAQPSGPSAGAAAGSAAGAPSSAEALQAELAQLPLDVQIAFESGLAMGLRPELVAVALARYKSIVNVPS